ncbi:hypothetical protein CPB86DRAFT_282666 [Serendipita vermifera]|nr:hypothetical protein CPB86DRAFT_282666 [Serendipita vermifera]
MSRKQGSRFSIPRRISSLPLISQILKKNEEEKCVQLPVELWRIILFEVVYTPLLPYSEPNRTSLQVGIVECLELFDASCTSYAQYRQNQSSLTNLRLVCRTWAIILQEYRGLCSVTNLYRKVLPNESVDSLSRAERVQIRGMERRHLGGCNICNYWQGQVKKPRLLAARSLPKLLRSDAVKAMLHPRVKILILNTYGVDLDDKLNDALNEALELATNLLGLAVQTASYFHWRKRLSGPLLRKLTHLSIQSITERSFERLPSSIELDSLQYLSLNLFVVHDSPPPPAAHFTFREWKFPQLKCLVLSGRVCKCLREDLHSLIRAGKDTLTELDFRVYDRKSRTLALVEDFREWLPNLCVYGTHLDALLENAVNHPLRFVDHNGPRLPSSPLTIAINWWTFQYKEELVRGISSLGDLLTFWGVKKLVLTQTWSHFEERWISLSGFVTASDMKRRLRQTKRILDAVEQADVLVCDRRGSTIHSTEAKPVWDALCKAQTDNKLDHLLYFMQ